MDGFLLEKGIELKPEFELATSDMIVQLPAEYGNRLCDGGIAGEAMGRGEVFKLAFMRRCRCAISALSPGNQD